MKIKSTITFTYSIDDSEITKFKSKVFEYIKEEMGEETKMTLDDISNETVEEFLSDTLPDILDEIHRGYCYDEGIECDDYFNTIRFDYHGGDVKELVREMAYRIMEVE